MLLATDAAAWLGSLQTLKLPPVDKANSPGTGTVPPACRGKHWCLRLPYLIHCSGYLKIPGLPTREY